MCGSPPLHRPYRWLRPPAQHLLRPGQCAETIWRGHEAESARRRTDHRSSRRVLGGTGAMSSAMGGWFRHGCRPKLGTLVTRDGSLNFTLFHALALMAPVAVLRTSYRRPPPRSLRAGSGSHALVSSVSPSPPPPPSDDRGLLNGDRFPVCVCQLHFRQRPATGIGVVPDVETPWTRVALFSDLAGRGCLVDPPFQEDLLRQAGFISERTSLCLEENTLMRLKVIPDLLCLAVIFAIVRCAAVRKPDLPTADTVLNGTSRRRRRPVGVVPKNPILDFWYDRTPGSQHQGNAQN